MGVTVSSVFLCFLSETPMLSLSFGFDCISKRFTQLLFCVMPSWTPACLQNMRHHSAATECSSCAATNHHHHHHHQHHHQSFHRQGRWGTTDDFATSFLHFFSLFSTTFRDLPNSRPVHSLMLSSHLFPYLPCLLSPFTVPRKMVLARPDERETWPYHCSLRLFVIIKRSLCGPIACWILARTSSLVTWSLYEMCSILW